MRTTLILEEATMMELRKKAVDEKKSLTEIVNETLKSGLGKFKQNTWKCQSFDLGGSFDYAKAWEKIDNLEANAVADKLELYK